MNNQDIIIEFIENNSTEIVENIDYESVEVYNFLQDQFETSNVNENYLFQFVYRSFYRLDNAGLTPEFKTEYFKILEEMRNQKSFDFERILKRLHNFPNRKGQNTLQFSFVTKLLNTIDNKLPIYDSEVAKMFCASRPYISDFNKKVDTYLEQLKCFQTCYEEVIYKDLLPTTIEKFDQRFKLSNLSEMKKLDFIFWSAGKIKKKYENSGDDGFHTLAELDEIDRVNEQ
jgi:hypothetical protein